MKIKRLNQIGIIKINQRRKGQNIQQAIGNQVNILNARSHIGNRFPNRLIGHLTHLKKIDLIGGRILNGLPIFANKLINFRCILIVHKRVFQLTIDSRNDRSQVVRAVFSAVRLKIDQSLALIDFCFQGLDADFRNRGPVLRARSTQLALQFINRLLERIERLGMPACGLGCRAT